MDTLEQWDMLKLKEYEVLKIKKAAGLCINCPEPFSDETIYLPPIKATYKYNQLEPMCDFHFGEIIKTVNAICYPLSGNQIQYTTKYRLK